MSWGGLLIAIAAALAAYVPHVDPHYVTLVSSLGAMLAAMGESILPKAGASDSGK